MYKIIRNWDLMSNWILKYYFNSLKLETFDNYVKYQKKIESKKSNKAYGFLNPAYIRQPSAESSTDDLQLDEINVNQEINIETIFSSNKNKTKKKSDKEKGNLFDFI